jgi:DNA mismatch repair ATPase MutS
MNAFLMFKDRDFDPDRILVARERKYHREDKPALEVLLPWNAQDLILDFGLDILFSFMSEGDEFLLETAKVVILSSLDDCDSILYRQNILKDCITNEEVVRDIYKHTIETIKKEKSIYSWGFLHNSPENILYQAISKLEMFSEMLRKLRYLADSSESRFSSEGFKRLFNMLKEELSDEYLESINLHLRQLKFKDGILVSAQLGEGNKVSNYVLHKPPTDDRNWFERLLSKKLPGFTYELHPRDIAGAKALSELRNQSINDVANALAQSMEHILNFFQTLRTELAFYIGCLNLYNKINQLKEQICFPEPFTFGKKKLSFSDLYDLNLALSSQQNVVSNNLNTDNKNLFIITGANTGGKSTFMRSIGIAQLMMQAGIFVPAENFSAEVRANILTHFKREEDVTMESGKLDEELSRMSKIIDNANSKSVIFLNESFAATNEGEGSEIAKQITEALVESGIKVFYVTHLHKFSYDLYKMKMPDFIFLRAERLADGKRTFKIKEGEPMQTSYGEDLFNLVFQK